MTVCVNRVVWVTNKIYAALAMVFLYKKIYGTKPYGTRIFYKDHLSGTILYLNTSCEHKHMFRNVTHINIVNGFSNIKYIALSEYNSLAHHFYIPLWLSFWEICAIFNDRIMDSFYRKKNGIHLLYRFIGFPLLYFYMNNIKILNYVRLAL